MLLSVHKKWKAIFNSINLPTHYHNTYKGGEFSDTIVLHYNNQLTFLKIKDFTDKFIAELRKKHDDNYKERKK